MTILLYDLVGRDPGRPFSPHCWKVRMALAHKGLDFESVPTVYSAIPAVESGASKTVPVIRDGNHVIADSFAIALYLEDAYPGRPSLFEGEGGRAMARFVEGWSQMTIHPFLSSAALMEIHDMLDPEGQEHFRTTREKRFGRRLEQVPVGREERLEAFTKSLEPLRFMLGHQPFIGGKGPLFADYIVFGAFQWMRIVSDFQVLDDDDPVTEWFERCLDLHGGIARQMPAAA
jgi:glutathione S-transferase